MCVILLHWKKRQISCKETQYRRFSIKRPRRLFQIWHGGPGISYTASTVFFIFPLLFRGLFTAVFTVVVFFHRE